MIIDGRSTSEYNASAELLVDRIMALIPEHPEILDLDDPWQLFTVPGFTTKDLDVTFFQASWALRTVQERYRQEKINDA